MYRSHDCGILRLKDVGREVCLCGWVNAIRRFGGLVFIDVRDRYGITQLVVDNPSSGEDLGARLGREYVIQAKGKVRERSNKNPDLPTGDIEVEVESVEILNSARTPPFTIEDQTDGGEELRMRYRYLDLRRPVLQKNLALRSRLVRSVRDFLHTEDFMEIETPFLIRSTPEGARDFVVPSRLNPGEFYALPQSPQTFKQLLMVSGYDRYFQIVKCFRDEDLRADRQPEFTQIDCELSFVGQEEILRIFEAMILSVFESVIGVRLPRPFPRLSYAEAMKDYGSDKPDLRFDMKIQNLKSPLETRLDFLHNSGFPLFDQAESVLALVVPGAGDYSRKQIDQLSQWLNSPSRKVSGIIYGKREDETRGKTSVDKALGAERGMAMMQAAGCQPGDLFLLVAGPEESTRKAVADLRLEMGNRLGLRKPGEYAPLWVVDFPLFEWDEQRSSWSARHHPFTAPRPEQEKLLDDPDARESLLAHAYDLVINGSEIGGGSLRIHRRDLQEKMFAALGLTEGEAREQFGFLMEAFEYGAPPHGGIALGLDRLAAVLGGKESIRDFMAFPKNNAGRDVMLDAPAPLNKEQQEELGLGNGK